MELRQREHVRAVMTLAGKGLSLPPSVTPDEIIRESRARCVHQYRLDPTRMQEAVILPRDRLREHQARIDELLFASTSLCRNTISVPCQVLDQREQPVHG